jgi:hypothetical protein
MTSWIYLLSQFTPEALLFEASIIFLLCCGYTAFWILRKRRYGVVDKALPSGPVRTYLNELITHAEQLRLQLFGLLASTDSPPVQKAPAPISTTPVNPSDPELAKKFAALEGQMAEQSKQLEKVSAEKSKLEKDLSEAKTAAASAIANAGGGSSGDEAKLQQKIQELESKLAEYNVIEDDLANLKRLQQENTQLKATLTSKGIPIPAAGAAPLVEAPAPASASAPPASSPAPAASSAPATPDSFDGLVAPVEQSLKSTPAAETPPAATSAAPAAGKSEAEKSEADLVAEFEKMLKG